MNDNDGFPSDHEETPERHRDTWVAGSGSVAAAGDTESSEGGSGWGHGIEHTTEAGETGLAEQVTDAEPGAGTVTTGNGAPPAPDTGEQIEHLIDPAESDRFHAAWREIQSRFVDDPRDAVHQASTLADEVLDALSTALKARVQAVGESWQGGADTERLRIALRGYRALLDQILAG